MHVAANLRGRLPENGEQSGRRVRGRGCGEPCWSSSRVRGGLRGGPCWSGGRVRGRGCAVNPVGQAAGFVGAAARWTLLVRQRGPWAGLRGGPCSSDSRVPWAGLCDGPCWLGSGVRERGCGGTRWSGSGVRADCAVSSVGWTATLRSRFAQWAYLAGHPAGIASAVLMCGRSWTGSGGLRPRERCAQLHSFGALSLRG